MLFITRHRRFRVGIILLVMALWVFVPTRNDAVASALIAATAESAEAASIPTPQSREAVRDLISRMPDEQVREMLIRQLDAQIAETPMEDGGASLIGRIPEIVDRVQLRFEQAIASLPAIGRELSSFNERLAAGRGSDTTWLVWLGMILIPLLAYGGERLFTRSKFMAERSPMGNDAGVAGKLMTAATGLVQDLSSLFVFVLVAFVLQLAVSQGHEASRIAIMSVVWVVVLWRAAAAAARVMTLPARPDIRVLPLTDAVAKDVYQALSLALGAAILAMLIPVSLARLGWDATVIESIKLLLAVALLLFAFGLLFVYRELGPRMALGDKSDGKLPETGAQRFFLRNWHIIAGVYLAIIALMAVGQRLASTTESAYPGLLSFLLILSLPLIDWAMRQGISHWFAPEEPEQADDGEEAPSDAVQVTDYAPVIIRNARILLALLVLALLGRIWGIDLQAWVAAVLGQTLADSLLTIVVTLILASALWGIVKTAIERHAPETAPGADLHDLGDMGGKGGSRLETLLPLLRKFLFVVLIVMVGMILLSSIGVDIGPLLAGAGMAGIAIGFGAQALVKDVVSGVFFLIDDAFRVGEYIDVGDVKGMVENISIRSLRLRHHRGPVHNIPFGEINHLTNFSRDWVIMKLELRLPFETDTEKVRKLIKKIGVEMMDHPDYGQNFIQPLKSQGVNRLDDSALIVRTKFMCKPGQQFVIRREAFRRIQEVFAENGIKFAPKRAIVDTPVNSPETAAAVAAQLDDAPPEGTAGDSGTAG